MQRKWGISFAPLAAVFMLHSHYRKADSSSAGKTAPIVVFVHGFLGCSEDWQAAINYLSQYTSIAIDLPGHGKSQGITCFGFDDACQSIEQSLRHTLKTNGESADAPLVLVGYSLGARLLMYGLSTSQFDTLNLVGCVIEGGNFGLQSDELRKKRYKADERWAKRFESEPIAQVLGDWYHQDVFSSLNNEQRQYLVTKRGGNLGNALASMLMATSLSKQPDLLESIQALRFKQSATVLYLCGAHDTKFRTLAEQSQLNYQVLGNAGHNVHVEQPEQFALRLKNYIEQMSPVAAN